MLHIEKQLAKGMTYAEYGALINNLLALGKTTSGDQSADYLNYTKLNLQRMRRLEKTIELSPELKSSIHLITGTYTWLVLTEGWCGDAAQNLPVLEKIEKESKGHIVLKLMLRDQNPELMNNYLTQGSRSIPKLVCIESQTSKEIFTWGPRPAQLQNLVLELKSKNVSSEEKSLLVQKWYNADKTATVQNELTTLIFNFLSA